MKLAAIFIDTHDFLFREPQTINFGTRHFYKFEKENEDIIVTRAINNSYIEGFFALTATKSSVNNVCAIVGQNGAGKSSLLDIIRSTFIENEYALPKSKSVIIVETKTGAPLILRNDFGGIHLNEGKSRIKLKSVGNARIQTIYYSPHFDYKYNPNFDDVDNHDISFDKIVENDLTDYNEKSTNENGIHYSPAQELLFKNALRQLEFLSSSLVKERRIFDSIFPLQSHYEPILHFRSYQNEQKDRNTPYQLRRILEMILKKAEMELDQWTSARKIEGDQVTNQHEVNIYILKRSVIKSLLALLKRQMERSNTYLQEGFFPYEKLENEIANADAYALLKLFIEHSTLKLGSGRPKRIFDEDHLPNLLTKIYEAIDKVTDEDNVSNETVKVSTEDAVSILTLQRLFLNELNRYYHKFTSKGSEVILNDRERVNEFVSYMPFSRRMSSGENALLNFYSRIYNFLHSNLKDVKFRNISNHYILLLDEADLTFHPSWKKKYVNALLNTLPYFFEELENNPSIEIIFTTHDPLTLSDLPNGNVIYVKRRDEEDKSEILDQGHLERPMKTFGANISELIADSFFLEKSLIGDFAFNRIQEAINWLNEKTNIENPEYFKALIKIIDEPIVQRKMAEMYDDKMKTNFQLDVVDDQIKRLNELRNKLRN